MQQPLTRENPATVLPFLSGGEMGRRIQEFDWASTPLGPFENWSQSLQNTVALMLSNRFPMLLWWGPDYISLYNDAYIPVLGVKHPWGLGKPVRECWSEIWPVLKPLIDEPFNGGPSTWSEDLQLQINRNNFAEETHFTVAYSPVPDTVAPGKIGGVLATVNEITGSVIAGRQMATLKEFGNRISLAPTEAEVYANAEEALGANPFDLPFCLLYKIENAGSKATLVATAGIEKTNPGVQTTIDLKNAGSRWKNLSCAAQENELISSENEGWDDGPKGAWDVMPGRFAYLPVKAANKKFPYAVLMVALNPYRRFDESYKNFLRLIAGQLSLGIANALAFEEEKKKTETLAEIDKAKTAFFTNISHEFRTPLTLMLGTVEEALKDVGTTGRNKERMTVTHRNAMRLLRLVNNLLDFSRLESGRTQAKFQRTDIAAYTAGLAGSFQSAIESAGLQFSVQTAAVTEPVYLDKGMWEKIVLNLLSNAFKYTLQGSISLSLAVQDDTVVLKVKDTGVGIPEEELPKMFQRFHRAQNPGGRSFEGTGIGLSLVKELVELHGGKISVQSKVGEGSEFTVVIPAGRQHQQRERVLEREEDFDFAWADGLVEEAKALAEQPQVQPTNPQTKKPATVLVVDDNADMRGYLQRLLESQYNVLAAVNGREALQLLKGQSVDLVLSDVMMPVMDGIELLKQLKAQPETATLPVVLVSARAGEEARVEGYDTGADDYLTKPFSANELLARVRSQIALAKKRRVTENNLRNLFRQAPTIIHILRGPEHVFEFFHPLAKEVTGGRDLTGLKAREALPEYEGQGFFEMLDEVYRTGKPVSQIEMRSLTRQPDGSVAEKYHDFVFQPFYDEEGKVAGILDFSVDVTDKVLARKRIEESQQELQRIFKHAPVAITLYEGSDFRITQVNQEQLNKWGKTEAEVLNKPLFEVIAESVNQGFESMLARVLRTGRAEELVEQHATTLRKGKKVDIYVTARFEPLPDAAGNINRIIAIVTDVTEQVLARKKVQEEASQTQAIFRQAPVTIVVYTGEEFVVEVANEMALHMWGKTEEEVINKPFFRIAPELRASQEPLLRNILQTGHPFVGREYFIAYNKGGQPCSGYFDFVYRPLRNAANEITGIVAIGTEVTESVEARKKIEESESRFRIMADASPNLVWVLNADASVKYVNKRVEEVLGVSQEAIIRNGWSQLLHPEEEKELMKTILDATANRRPFSVEQRLVQKDGSYRWYLASAAPSFYANGELYGYVGSTVDIHEQKMFSEKLENQVAQRTKELQRSNEDLQQFAHVASHDLKEPVRKIMTFCSLLRNELREDLPEKAKGHLTKMESATTRMYAMIDGVLLYSSLNALEQTKESIDLNETMDSIASDLEVLIAEKDAEIVYNNLPTIEGSAILFYQLFYNLVKNSLKFSKPGVPPVIRLRSEHAAADELKAKGLNPAKAFVKISIADNGIGFLPEQAEKIFITFTRLHSKDKYEGTGLGLSLCRKIAERHGGVLWAEGEEGVGATFTLLLPV